MEKPENLKQTGNVRVRVLAGLALMGLAGISSAQFLTGTGGSLSSGFASDSATYTPSSGGNPVSLDNYYSNSQSPPNANFTNSHSFSTLVIPGVGGTTNANDLGSVVDSLTIGANSANFASTILARAGLSTSITGAGSDKEVTAASEGQAQDSFLFTVGQATVLTLTGSSSVSYTGTEAPYTVTLELVNTSTSQTTYFVQQTSGTINTALTLSAGSYQLFGYADVATGIDYSAYQGYIKNNLGNANIDLQYNAAFAPVPAPEPVTTTLLIAGLGAALRRRARRS